MGNWALIYVRTMSCCVGGC